MSWPGSPRTRMRPIGPASPMRFDGAPRSTLAGGASERSGRWPSRVWITSMPVARAASSTALQGPTAACSRETSLPSVSPKPPGSRKSRCMSMMISAVRSRSTLIGCGSAAIWVIPNASLVRPAPRRSRWPAARRIVCKLPASQALCHGAIARPGRGGKSNNIVKTICYGGYSAPKRPAPAAAAAAQKSGNRLAGGRQSAATVCTSINSGSCTSRSIISSVLGG